MTNSASGSPVLPTTAAGMCRRREDSSLTRNTKDCQTLTYYLTVIQQPDRARAYAACTDRRPVNPPPIVELHIFEGNGADSTDITSSYSGNFFLCITLERACPVAPDSMQQPKLLVPVLDGNRVSSIAYLDRPRPAGYFIFPDLSIPFPGRYRLSFNLYEETKEDKDTNPERSNERARFPIPGTMFSNASISWRWRLEVKSAEFTVCSAKLFPGMAESTELSNLLIEQGYGARLGKRSSRRSNRHREAVSPESPSNCPPPSSFTTVTKNTALACPDRPGSFDSQGIEHHNARKNNAIYELLGALHNNQSAPMSLPLLSSTSVPTDEMLSLQTSFGYGQLSSAPLGLGSTAPFVATQQKSPLPDALKQTVQLSSVPLGLGSTAPSVAMQKKSPLPDALKQTIQLRMQDIKVERRSRNVCSWPGCGKALKSSLSRHEKSHTMRDSRACQFCGTILKNEECLRIHIKRHDEPSRLDYFVGAREAYNKMSRKSRKQNRSGESA